MDRIHLGVICEQILQQCWTVGGGAVESPRSLLHPLSVASNRFLDSRVWLVSWLAVDDSHHPLSPSPSPSHLLNLTAPLQSAALASTRPPPIAAPISSLLNPFPPSAPPAPPPAVNTSPPSSLIRCSCSMAAKFWSSP